MFQMFFLAKDSLLDLHMKVDFEGVLGVEIMALKIFLQLDLYMAGGIQSFIDLAQS